METLKNIKVPTGNILIVKGECGKLECLSLGDYGKNQNIKADFLGITKPIDGVPNGKIMPLSEKWVVTISTQYGCSMGCKFCDVPKVGPGKNATLNDLSDQVKAAVILHPEIGATKRLNIHYARMGEPTFNKNVLTHAIKVRKDIYPLLNRSLIHPVVSTMLPRRNKNLIHFLQEWCEIKNYTFRGDAGLQFSVNSTSDEQREYMFNGNSLSLSEISEIGKYLPDPVGRKYTINVALIDGVEVNGAKMKKLFSPNKFMVKITPIHVTASTDSNSLQTTAGYEAYTPYETVENDLKEHGFDVLVFIPSLDEDRGRITCGNAILSGSKPECDYQFV